MADQDGYAFRLQYLDGSGIEIYADGRVLVTQPDGTSRGWRGTIINKIPRLIAEAEARVFEQGSTPGERPRDENPR